ncbi:cell wall-active antibiotics response protein LiaF [Aerococcaceae bacterium WGS1372]
MSYFFTNRWIRRILLIIGLFIIIVNLLLLRSLWVLVIVLILFFILFRTEDGNEFIHLKEAFITPKRSDSQYYGVKLIEPQSSQRTMLKQESLFDMFKESHQEYEWDDVNIVTIGGNQIIDFGNTILPMDETTIVIRKFFGRTRIIIPNEIGIKLNISLISGAVVFESQRYPLTSENFKWMSPDYRSSKRQINLIISVVFGDVEVIII